MLGALPRLSSQLLRLHHMVRRHLVRGFCSTHAGRLPLLRFQLLRHLPPPSSQLRATGHTTLLLHVACWCHVGVLPLLRLPLLRQLRIQPFLANGHAARLLCRAWRPAVEVLPLPRLLPLRQLRIQPLLLLTGILPDGPAWPGGPRLTCCRCCGSSFCTRCASSLFLLTGMLPGCSAWPGGPQLTRCRCCGSSLCATCASSNFLLTGILPGCFAGPGGPRLTCRRCCSSSVFGFSTRLKGHEGSAAAAALPSFFGCTPCASTGLFVISLDSERPAPCLATFDPVPPGAAYAALLAAGAPLDSLPRSPCCCGRIPARRRRTECGSGGSAPRQEGGCC